MNLHLYLFLILLAIFAVLKIRVNSCRLVAYKAEPKSTALLRFNRQPERYIFWQISPTDTRRDTFSVKSAQPTRGEIHFLANQSNRHTERYIFLANQSNRQPERYIFWQISPTDMWRDTFSVKPVQPARGEIKQ